MFSCGYGLWGEGQHIVDSWMFLSDQTECDLCVSLPKTATNFNN